MATVALAPPLPVHERADRRGLSILALAHAVNDANQSALPAIIPWLVTHRGLSLATAATLVLAMNLSSSVVQPLFGYLSDRRSMAFVIPISMLLACAGTAAIGLAPTLPLMWLGALVAGIGVAAFHPESSRFANYFAGARRATGMSWFTGGGYIGFALGPVVVTPLILAFGLHGTVALLVPGVLVAALLWRELPRFEAARAHAHRQRAAHAGVDDWRGFGVLVAVVTLRSSTFLAAVTFLPIFALSVTHVDKLLASVALAIMLLGGAAGTIYGGRVADRIDRRRVVHLSLVLTAAFGTAIAASGWWAPSFALLLPLALGYGASLGFSNSVVVLLGQEYLPQRIGVASGVTLGLAVTIGGVLAPFFGAIGDRFGLVPVFAAVAAFAVLALVASQFLPPSPGRTARVTGSVEPGKA